MQDGGSSQTQLRPSSKENSRAVLLLNRKLSHEIANRLLYWSYQAVHFLPGRSNIKNNHLRISDISVSFCQQLLLKMSGVNENILPLQLWAWTGQWARLWDLQPLRKRRALEGWLWNLNRVSLWIQLRKAEENQVPPQTQAQRLLRSRLELEDNSMMQLFTDLAVCSASCKLESSFK